MENRNGLDTAQFKGFVKAKLSDIIDNNKRIEKKIDDIQKKYNEFEASCDSRINKVEKEQTKFKACIAGISIGITFVLNALIYFFKFIIGKD